MTLHVAGCRTVDTEHSGICRDATGKPRVILPDGKTVRSYARASSHGDALDDKGGLIAWSQANAVRGALTNASLGSRFLAVDDGWVTVESKTATKAVIAEAAVAGGAEVKANRGTDLHEWTEMLDRGEPIVGLRPEHEADLMAYEYATEGMVHLEMERFVVLDDYRVGGSFDRLTRWSDHPCPECLLVNYIFDIKSGSVAFAQKMAVQLAVYAHSQFYDQETESAEDEPGSLDSSRAIGVRRPLPPVCQHRAIILHLPAGEGTAEPLWLNIEAGWTAVQEYVPVVKSWRSRKDLLTPVSA